MKPAKLDFYEYGLLEHCMFLQTRIAQVISAQEVCSSLSAMDAFEIWICGKAMNKCK